VATETNLITSFVRRISKYFLSDTATWYRPRSIEPGLNHIDDPASFDEKTIYKGEEIVDLDRGRLFTQDGAEIIELNTDNEILSGLLVREPSPAVLESTVEHIGINNQKQAETFRSRQTQT